MLSCRIGVQSEFGKAVGRPVKPVAIDDEYRFYSAGFFPPRSESKFGGSAAVRRLAVIGNHPHPTAKYRSVPSDPAHSEPLRIILYARLGLADVPQLLVTQIAPRIFLIFGVVQMRCSDRSVEVAQFESECVGNLDSR